MRGVTAVMLIAGVALAIGLWGGATPPNATAQTGQDRFVVFETFGREA